MLPWVILGILFSLVALVAVLAFLYWFYPRPIIHLSVRYLGFLLARLRRKFIYTKDFTFCYYERKPTAAKGCTDKLPTVLLLHGYNSDKTLWLGTIRYLPKDWGIVVLDLPGHGESSFKPKADYSPTGMAEKVDLFMEALDLDKFHLAGISYGAGVAGTYADLYPHKLLSLTIMTMPGMHRLPGGQITPYMEQLEAERHNFRFLLPLTEKDLSEMLKCSRYKAEENMPHYRLRKAIIDMLVPKYTAFKEIMDDGFLTDVVKHIREMSARITMATLIVWGNDDKMCHPAGAEVLGSMIQNSKVVKLSRCGHAIMMDRPRKLAKVLEQFVNDNHNNPSE